MAARRQPNPHSESVDDYLKAILALEGPEERRATSTALADWLGVAPASVTNMLQKLAALPTPLVEYERHRGVRLSQAGKTARTGSFASPSADRDISLQSTRLPA